MFEVNVLPDSFYKREMKISSLQIKGKFRKSWHKCMDKNRVSITAIRRQYGDKSAEPSSQVIPGNLQKRILTNQSSLVQNFAVPFLYQCVGTSFAEVCLKARLEVAVP